MSNAYTTAAIFLTRELRTGPMYLDDLVKLAAKKNISPRSLQRAARMLGVHRRTRGFGANRYSLWKIDRAIAEQYRDTRMRKINGYHALAKALTRAAVDVTDYPEALARVEEFRFIVLRDIAKLKAKGVDNL